jgi:hypothetical protein
MIRRFVATLLATVTMGAHAQSAAHRAILISFDGFSEQRLRQYADSAAAPHVWSMFATSSCAESVRPAMPSVTPVSHAAIWTGAYAKTTGVSASSNGALPWPETTILDWIDGYSAKALRAEPIWITAARQGKRVYSHIATQSPQPPAYAVVEGDTPELDSARVRAARALARPNVAVLNVYNEMIAPTRTIRSTANLDWAFGNEGDSLHARIANDSTLVVELNHTRRTVAVHLAPTDTTDPSTRPLARFMSEPLRVDLRNGRTTFVFFRLWDLSRPRLLLWVSEARVIQANQPAIAAEYNEAVRGLVGNAGGRLMEAGEFGPRVQQGGDGTAEFRYFETAELVTRQFMRGTEWGWKRFTPELETDYLPYPDEALHTFLGYADPSTPGVTPAARANAARMLRRTYTLVDVRLAQMQRLAASTPNTRLYVTGEHGMRPTWLAFKPNVVLKAAGLLRADSAGNIDLAHTRAAFTRGAWVSVNRLGRKNGIVPADSVNAVLGRVEQALRAARDSGGTPIVTRFYRASTMEGDSLGIGGPGGGDLYFAFAPGYYWGPAAIGDAVVPLRFPMGEHGYPSTDFDMQPLLCIGGGNIAHARNGAVRTIDIAPTVSQWLGISPPANAQGRALTWK